jgi:methylenetetrahydrofolate reductase (NADPH)
MKISDLLARGGITVSCELFPPKQFEKLAEVKDVVARTAALGPSFISCTYGATGGTSEYTIDIAKEINAHGVPALAHLTCVSSSKETVVRQIASLKKAGICNVMALRGDIPPGRENEDRSLWDYRYATELVRDLRGMGDFCIGGACYPEIHPESSDQKTDIRYLREKVDAGCDFLTTQMFFDNHLLYNFLYKIREAGITVPVVAGIMPITNARQVERAIKLSGSMMPQRFRAIVDRFGTDPAAMSQAGIAYATDQIIDLFANGINHVHVYSMNKPYVAQQISANLSAIIKK